MYPGTNCEPTFKLRCMTAAPIVKPLLSSATKHSRISREHVAQQRRHVKPLVFNEVPVSSGLLYRPMNANVTASTNRTDWPSSVRAATSLQKFLTEYLL